MVNHGNPVSNWLKLTTLIMESMFNDYSILLHRNWTSYGEASICTRRGHPWGLAARAVVESRLCSARASPVGRDHPVVSYQWLVEGGHLGVLNVGTPENRWFVTKND